MTRTNILFIAPYEEIVPLVRRVAAEYPDLSVTVEVANLERALPAAWALNASQFDVVISRGGTGRLLAKELPVPTVFVELSGSDLLRLIQVQRMYEGKSAMVCFAELAEEARALCGLLRVELDIYAINGSAEAEERILALKEAGCSLILGDVISVTVAERLGLKTALATSGPESIRKAFDAAARIAGIVARSDMHWRHAANLLMMQKTSAVVLDAAGEVAFRTLEADDALLASLRAQLPLLREKGELSGVTATAPVNYSFTARRCEGAEEEFYFVLTPLPLRGRRRAAGLTVLSPGEETPVSFNAFLTRSAAMRACVEEARRAAASAQTVMVYGKPGTEREAMAQAIHWNGPFGNAPLYRVDVLQAQESLWHTLLRSESSPLLGSRYTLLLTNFQQMPLRVQAMLLQFIRDSGLLARARIITVSGQSPERLLADEGFLAELVALLSGASIRMPELRERREDIRSLVSLCIDESAREGGGVIGVEEEALRCLQEYDWPYNLPQLRRQIRRCVAETQGAFVTPDTVCRVLEEEREDARSSVGTLDLQSGTLEEMETAIIRRVLEQENMNQKRAAKRLGISRTTMWRKLKRTEDP